jgi:hypothetical protein
MKITRKWAMPSSDTFDVPPIGEFVKSYLRQSKISIDPFARNKRWATYTNDLSPATAAEHHLDAEIFLSQLQENGIIADLVIFDPPYSPRQISEVYQSIGRTVTMEDTQNSALYSRVRKKIYPLVSVGGIVLSFGWNSHGMSNSGGREWEILEIMLVCHGAAHNDTICMAERKTAHQPNMFGSCRKKTESYTQ